MAQADTSEWTKVKDFKEAPASGWPCHVRIGSGNRRLAPRKDKPGWVNWPGMATVMVPEDGQTIECWSDVWRLDIADPATLALAEWETQFES